MKVNNPLKVDLNRCKPGSLLLTKHGEIVTYLRKIDPEIDYYDHRIEYKDGSEGTRTNDGFVYRNESKRLPEDHDIIRIIKI